MVKSTNLNTNELNDSTPKSNNLTFEKNNTGGTHMKKQIHIQVSGFDIYLGVSKNTAYQENELIKAYEREQLEREREIMKAKAEYEMRRLSA